MSAAMRRMMGPVAAMALALVACKGMGGGEETTEAKAEDTKKKKKKTDDEGETKSAKSDAEDGNDEKAGGDLAEAPEPAPEIVPGKEATALHYSHSGHIVRLGT